MMRGMRAALLDRRVVVTGGEETQRNWMGAIQEIETIVMNQVVRVVLWNCSYCVGSPVQSALRWSNIKKISKPGQGVGQKSE